MFSDVSDEEAPELGRFDTFHHEADALDPEPNDADFDDVEVLDAVV